MDWIVQKVLGGAPIMDGHRQSQEKVSNPAMVFLRQAALTVEEAKQLDRSLTARDLFRLIDAGFGEVPTVVRSW